MANRPILRFPNPTHSVRLTGIPRSQPKATGPSRYSQGQRFQTSFNRLAEALDSHDPEFVLRQDPTGIAPERALAFVTAGNIQNFSGSARKIGLEVIAENDIGEIEDFPDGFEPAGGATTLERTLYATMPTLESFKKILSLWNAHQNDESAPPGFAPWWTVFDLLLELRPWGPTDRFNETARSIIRERLPFDDDEEVPIELEIWPTANVRQRAQWRQETEQRIYENGGRILDSSSISYSDFIYDAILAGLPTKTVRTMLNDPANSNTIVTFDGLQFILPQMVGQSGPIDPERRDYDNNASKEFVNEAPLRGALFDGTPMAGHPALNGGVMIEDIHDLVRLSIVEQRYHATAMASLILRGDLEVDGHALQDTRLVCVPLLIDRENGAWTPNDKLFVDLLHTTLTHLLTGDNPLAPDVFVINFSIGVRDMRFAGRVSSLARLIDWWASKEGVLFVISAGNIGELQLSGVNSVEFEDANEIERRSILRTAFRNSIYDRTLLAPAEALNGLAVGALSKDLNGHVPPIQTGVITLESDSESQPQITSAVGLGPLRSIKPDLLHAGGRQEVRLFPNAADAILQPLQQSQRTGLVAAASVGGEYKTQKSRGTSPAAALTTRAILQSAEALTIDGGPYEGQDLPRRNLALLTRALAVNSARWPESALNLYEEERDRLGTKRHMRAKEEVCRYFGYGVVAPELMKWSPENGVTVVGLGSIRKNQAQIFRIPLPVSMSGERVPRSMRVTLAWFTPVNVRRAQYRLAGLDAVVADEDDDNADKAWRLDLRTDGPDSNMIKRGSVWSYRLINRIQSVPDFNEGEDIPIRVQCRDTADGGLSPDDDIDFAIVVTLLIETDVQYDIYEEITQKLRMRFRIGQ